MAVTALAPGLFPTALALPLPAPAPAALALPAPREPEAAVFSSAPLRVLAEVAATGLQQLSLLTPLLERAVESPDPAPLGHVAKAVGTAARQVAEGHSALLAEGPDRVARALLPSAAVGLAAETGAALRREARRLGTDAAPPFAPTSEALRAALRQLGAAQAMPLHVPDGPPVVALLSHASHLLRRAGTALETASSELAALPAATPQVDWALAEVAVARANVLSAATGLDDTVRLQPDPTTPPRRIHFGPGLGPVSAAFSLLGLLLLLVCAALLAGAWLAGFTVAGLLATGLWTWRILRAARTVRLDPAR